MFRVSMPDFADALSSFKQNLSKYYKRFAGWAGLKRKKYVLKKHYRVKKDYVYTNLKSYGEAYGKYFLYEFLPFVVSYGLVVNFPLSVLLGWALTVETVFSWGLVFYIVSEELTEIANELKPYVRVSAKVDS